MASLGILRSIRNSLLFGMFSALGASAVNPLVAKRLAAPTMSMAIISVRFINDPL